jgi:hypothetical protein
MKTCRVCGLTANTDIDLNNFVSNKRSPLGKANICKACKRAETKKEYHNDPQKRIAQNKCFRQTKKVKGILDKGGKCSKCGIEYNGENACIFDFHHTDPSQKDFSPSSFRHKSWEQFKTEIDKCDLLCANCHRLEHNSGY